MVPGMSEIPGLKIFREKPKYLAVNGYCERASYIHVRYATRTYVSTHADMITCTRTHVLTHVSAYSFMHTYTHVLTHVRT